MCPSCVAPAVFPRSTCVGYCRVSTVEQARHGWSIGQQEDAIRARAVRDGLTVLAVFRDAGRSGRTMQGRPGLLALLRLVAQGGVGVVIAKSLDRLARTINHAFGLRYWFHRHESDLLFLDGEIHHSPSCRRSLWQFQSWGRTDGGVDGRPGPGRDLHVASPHSAESCDGGADVVVVAYPWATGDTRMARCSWNRMTAA